MFSSWVVMRHANSHHGNTMGCPMMAINSIFFQVGIIADSRLHEQLYTPLSFLIQFPICEMPEYFSSKNLVLFNFPPMLPSVLSCHCSVCHQKCAWLASRSVSQGNTLESLPVQVLCDLRGPVNAWENKQISKIIQPQVLSYNVNNQL